MPDLTYYGDIYAAKDKDCKLILLKYNVFKRMFLYELEEIKNRFEVKNSEYLARNKMLEYCWARISKRKTQI